MNEWAKKNTVQCEVVKIAMSQDKNGHILKLAIHPNDLPKDLVLDRLGTRYVMVLAKLNDQDEIEAPKDKSEGEKAVDSAGLLCRNERFRKWMANKGLSVSETERDVIEAVKAICGVHSRSEFVSDESARAKFLSLRREFSEAYSKGEVPK